MKPHTEGAVLVVKEPTEVVRDWPTYYYNTERYREYVKRKAWHRRGKEMKSPLDPWEKLIGKMLLNNALWEANKYLDDNNLRK